MFEDQKKAILDLIAKAADAHDANDALKFSQAATNAANALCSLRHATQPEPIGPLQSEPVKPEAEEH